MTTPTPYNLSDFGHRFARGTGAYQLMADLGAAAELPNALMLGGGNPALIPDMEAVFRRELVRLADDPNLYRHWGGCYSAPEGDAKFRHAIADMLKKHCGWPLTAANIALTAGSQSAFFMLFNMFAGSRNSSPRHIWLPMTPEYVGYADVGVGGSLLRGADARIELIGDHFFKYRLDPKGLEIGPDAGAVCLSRPTNPTGNVLTDDEVLAIEAAARKARVPLILDCAYGMPFPGIVFVPSTLQWNENMVVCFSLSKLGLPGLRTGIVVANEQVVRGLGAMSGVMNLAPPSFGPALMEPLVRSGEILQLAEKVLRPEYKARLDGALAALHETFTGFEWRAHVPEGAFFMWLWFPELSVSSQQLYERLKARGVFVLSGHHFFPEGSADGKHRTQCLRISYAQSPEMVRRGLQAIAEEVRAISS